MNKRLGKDNPFRITKKSELDYEISWSLVWLKDLAKKEGKNAARIAAEQQIDAFFKFIKEEPDGKQDKTPYCK
jgi:hypothetical protein